MMTNGALDDVDMKICSFCSSFPERGLLCILSRAVPSYVPLSEYASCLKNSLEDLEVLGNLCYNLDGLWGR